MGPILGIVLKGHILRIQIYTDTLHEYDDMVSATVKGKKY